MVGTRSAIEDLCTGVGAFLFLSGNISICIRRLNFIRSGLIWVDSHNVGPMLIESSSISDVIQILI
jgi:hypothetical protein